MLHKETAAGRKLPESEEVTHLTREKNSVYHTGPSAKIHICCSALGYRMQSEVCENISQVKVKTRKRGT